MSAPRYYCTHPDPEGAFRETLELARRAPHYAAHLAGVEASSLAELSRIPLTTKEHMRGVSPWGMIAVPREELWHYHESTGTTGEPIACWYRREELDAMGDAVAKWFPELAPGKILLNRFPGFAPISFCIEAALQRTGACNIPCGNLSWDVPFPRAIDFLQTLQPQIVACLPLEMFFLRGLADVLEVPAEQLNSLEMAILAGAPLPPTMRRIVERDWGVKVREIYGSNETLFLGASPDGGPLHLETSLFIAEILDPESWEPVEEGSPGILTLTHLGPKAMPLVRYPTRDFVRVIPSDRPEPAVELLGRLDDLVEIGGKRLMTSEILEAGYQLADANQSTIFFAVVREDDILFRVETADSRWLDPKTVVACQDFLGAPVKAEAVPPRDVFDPSSLARTPRVYKPSQIANWTRGPRKPLTILEALLEWPKMDATTGLDLLKRTWRTNRARRRLRR